MDSHNTFLAACFLTAIVMLPARADDAAAVTIERVQWGFDGKAQERTFIPLSVLVRNNTALEFEGTLRLTKLVQTTKPIDATVEREVYVGPISSRWVQFVPYVIGDWEQWRLTWGHSAEENFDIPTPQIGEPATVLLYDPEDLQLAGGVLRRFPSQLFPAAVTGTDGLRGVVMDRPPKWQGARRQAFLDWLTLGGRLYLLQDEQGHFPKFPESLDVLNGSSDRFRVGTGSVQRLGKSVRELDPEYVRQQILTGRPAGVSVEQYQKQERLRRSPYYTSSAPLMNRSGWDRDTQTLLDLQTITRFARRWWVIYLLALFYLFALFPVCYRVGREAKDYRWLYLVLVATVALFSYGFASLSKLGASEVSRARSVAVARQLSEGLFDVTQWTCLGVRAAGDYVVDHNGTGRHYTTSQDMERIDGTIIDGTTARMELEIPPASTRTSLHRARCEAPPLGLSVVQTAFDERGLDVLTVGVGPEFPDKPMMILAAHLGRIYEMRRVGDQLLVVPSSQKPLVSYLTDYYAVVRTVNLLRSTTPSLDENTKEADVYRDALRTLVGNSFGLSEHVDPQRLTLNDETVRIFVYAPMPEALMIRGDEFPDQDGYVLYAVDLLAQAGAG